MNIFINILVAFICFIFGYLFGSIPTSVIIGKVKFHQDPRNFGSGNAGATNAGRLWGKKWRIIIIILDGLKTFLPFLLSFIILTYVKIDNGQPLIATTEHYYISDGVDYTIKWPVYWLSVVGTVLGHCFPLFAGFRGGKGAASFIGIGCWASWLCGFIPFISYLIIKGKTKYVSLAVLLSGLICLGFGWIYTLLWFLKVIPVELYWLPTYGPFFNIPLYFPATMTICYALVVSRHHGNIKRLIDGNERKTLN